MTVRLLVAGVCVAAAMVAGLYALELVVRRIAELIGGA